MNNVSQFPEAAMRRKIDSMGQMLQGSGEPPDNGDMDAQVTALEKDMKEVRERLIKIEAKLDGMPSLFTTKPDLSEAKTQIIMWVVGAVLFAQVLPPLLKRFGF